jgi:SAM-dependent methyltransferase
MKCPICGSTKFENKSKRKNAQCSGCGAMERTRLLFLILKKFDVLKPGIRILHFNPEGILAKIFSSLSASEYYPFAVDQRDYSYDDCRVIRLNLCDDIYKFPEQSFDLIIHNHVLETVPCSVEFLLRGLSRILRPKGHHFFTTFVEKGYTDEIISPMNPQERIDRFGRADRVRKFGHEDFIPLLSDLWQTETVYVKNSEFLELEEYLEAALPEQLFYLVTPSTIFHESKQHARPII